MRASTLTRNSSSSSTRVGTICRIPWLVDCQPNLQGNRVRCNEVGYCNGAKTSSPKRSLPFLSPVHALIPRSTQHSSISSTCRMERVIRLTSEKITISDSCTVSVRSSPTPRSDHFSRPETVFSINVLRLFFYNCLVHCVRCDQANDYRQNLTQRRGHLRETIILV